MDLKDKHVVVLGLGRSGQAVCRFLLSRQARVTASEIKSLTELLADKKIRELKEAGVTLEAGGHRWETLAQADLIVLSPGVPPLPELEKLKAQGKKILPEIELAYHFLKGKIVSITGSNGKSTTATLTHKILSEGGLPAFLAGNIGFPLTNLVDSSSPSDIYVVELSSFQLTYIEQFTAEVAVLLNITPDHLDWHPSFDHYKEAKQRLILSQPENSLAILNRDDAHVWELNAARKALVWAFSLSRPVTPGMYLEKDWLYLHLDQPTKFLHRQEVPLFGPHNLENIMAAALVGKYFGLPDSRIKNSILTFRGLEHRLEKVTSIDGITFFNDSKATNVDATLKSIQSFEENLILILGGRDKGSDFKQLIPALKNRVKAAILLGEAKEKIQKALAGTVPLHPVSSLVEAVERGYSLARPGDVVLLAPACTSFDMFKNFEERGRRFKEAVLALKERVQPK